MRQEITLSDVMSRIQQAQTVLLVWQLTLTTDDGKAPDMVESVLTILDGLPDAVAVQMEGFE